MKHSMLSQLLLPAARERLSRIQLVRPQRADQITGLLARMAQSGQLRGRVSEDQLVDVLNQVEAMEQRGQGGASAGGPAESKIVVRPKNHGRNQVKRLSILLSQFSRRKGNYSDDEDDFGLPSTSSTAAAVRFWIPIVARPVDSSFLHPFSQQSKQADSDDEFDL